MAVERRWRAMGADAHVVVLGGRPGLADQACARIEDLEARWSRFRPDSDIARLNRAGGQATTVSPDTFDLVERSLLGWRLTDGRFDPTVGAALIAAGYDRDFSEVAARDPLGAVSGGGTPAPSPGLGGLELDRAADTVRLPPGVIFDPGGLGKGFAADLVSNELLACGADGALVNVGGDLATAGQGPDDGGWVIDIDHPTPGRPPLLHMSIGEAGIATSSRLRRRWQVGGHSRHHLIDPATGRPTDAPLATVTVIAGEAWWAEAQTKAAFVSGHVSGVLQGSTLAVLTNGTVVASPDLDVLLRAAA